jgi:23S rRNA pseudouridine2605 synthase
MAAERLQKILARAGVASRRGAELLITQRRVTVDGRVVSELGARAEPTSRIEVDGRPIAAEPLVYLVFHKPRNVVSTMSDPEGRPTVAEYLKRVGARVVPVGRLDFHTSGTLLLTNDGDFAAALLHPRHHAAKVYVAKVSGIVTDEDLERWRQPIEIDGRPTRPAEVERLRVEGDKTWLEIVLHEGKNRQIHRLGEATGFPVMRLARLSFAGIDDEGLRPGHYRHLTETELLRLKREYGVPRRLPPRGAPEPEPRRASSTSRREERARPTFDRSTPPRAPDHRRGSARPRRAPGGNRTR